MSHMTRCSAETVPARAWARRLKSPEDMLDEMISFTPIGLPMGDLFWGLFASIVMYLAPACIALVVLALAGRRQARAGKVIAFPAAQRPARPREARKEEKKRAA